MTRQPVDVGIATRALPAEPAEPCGDVGFCVQDPRGMLVGLIDGLGHGPKAHDIAERARDEIARLASEESLAGIFERLATAFRGDRGFVAALVRVPAGGGTLEFCGIGNITARLFDDREYTLLSGEGIVGSHSARPRVRGVSFPGQAFIVMHTDGISSHLRARHLLEHRALAAEDFARAILDAHARPNDDAGVVVIMSRE